MPNQNQQEQKRGLFSRQAAPPDAPITADISTLSTRIRLAEEKINNINRKLELLESNFVSSNKKNTETLRVANSDILELKREIQLLTDKLELVIRELKLTAGKDELNTIKRYLELWNLTRFVSRAEIDKIVEEKVNEVLKKSEEE